MAGRFSIPIQEVAELIGLSAEKPAPGKGFYVQCPFCSGDSRSNAPKMLINTRLNAYVCPRCGEHGGTLDLYARMVTGRRCRKGEASPELIRELCGKLSLNDPEDRRFTAPAPSEADGVDRAPDSRVSAVYYALLRIPEFRLSERHHRELLARGLSEAAIQRNGYRSFDLDALKQAAPDGDAWREAARRVERDGLDMTGVPGFFQDNGAWKFALRSGLAIPVRSARREVVGLQVRTDSGSARYITVSSARYGGVDRDICRTHFPLRNASLPPAGSADAKAPAVVLTEGPLKADTALDILSRTGNTRYFFLAIPGVTIVRELPDIFRALRRRGITTIALALDMDRCVNPNVAKAGRHIRKLAKDQGLRAVTWIWGDEDIETMWTACRDMLEAGIGGASLHTRLSADELRAMLGTETCTAAEKAENMARLTALLPRDMIRSLPEWPKRSKGIDDHCAAAALSIP